MLRAIIFIVVSGGIFSLSWSSLRSPLSHGLFRFFAFESILALILLHVDLWLKDPFSVRQIVSWLLLLASLFLVMHGFVLLQKLGKPRGRIENTTTLVTRGAYRFIRHPLYSSLLLLGWGAFLKDPAFLSSILVLISSGALIAAAKVEESENVSKFGHDYAAYMERTKMFIPFLL